MSRTTTATYSSADIFTAIGEAIEQAAPTFGFEVKGLTYVGAIREMARLHAELKAKCQPDDPEREPRWTQR